MARVVLIHSALGLSEHVEAWAQALRDESHEVITPDLFDGTTFVSLEQGAAYVDSVGLGELVRRARELVGEDDGPRVYAGFSLGAAVAEVLAFSDPEALGCVIMHGAINPAWFDITQWPPRLRAQLHVGIDDPWNEPEENAAFVALAGEHVDVFEYHGTGHLFGFDGWTEHDSYSAALMLERVRGFLDQDLAPAP